MPEALLVKLTDLVSFPQNPKQHDIPQIIASIRRFGFVDRILINKRTGHLLSGHGRGDALTRIKNQPQTISQNYVPAGITVDKSGEWLVPADEIDVAEDQEGPLVIALNRLTETGGWDEDLLAKLLIEIRDAGPDNIIGIGYSERDIDTIIANQLAELAEEAESQDTAIVYNQAVQLEPEKEYVIVFCDPDEFHILQTALGLETVRRGGFKIDSAFDNHGIERVITLSRLLSAMGIDDTEGKDATP